VKENLHLHKGSSFYDHVVQYLCYVLGTVLGIYVVFFYIIITIRSQCACLGCFVRDETSPEVFQWNPFVASDNHYHWRHLSG
jgi:hypothetical protein